LINVDSAGHRRTVETAVAPGTPDTVRLFFFGGSTMWGTNLRDKATIASVAAQQLAAAVPKGVAVEVTNFGESGYVFTQELIELELQLRSGNVPDVVLFYDGMCDMTAAVQYGAAGTPMNEGNRSREFDFGRAVWGAETGVGSDLRAASAIGSAVLQRMQFIQRLFAIVARPAATRPPEWLARDVARAYAGNAAIVEALSRAYGFRALYVWQPTLYSTTKTPTPFEQSLLSKAKGDPLYLILREMNKTTVPVLDSTMRSRVGARFIDETSLFAGDTSSVFADALGHTTEKAVLPIVGRFLPVLTELVDSARVPGRRSRAASASRTSSGRSSQN
jgi:lysophospholipase L1-like esterase